MLEVSFTTPRVYTQTYKVMTNIDYRLQVTMVTYSCFISISAHSQQTEARSSTCLYGTFIALSNIILACKQKSYSLIITYSAHNYQLISCSELIYQLISCSELIYQLISCSELSYQLISCSVLSYQFISCYVLSYQLHFEICIKN